MTKEAILARIAELKALRDGHIANANACNGAIQDCEHWLAVLAAEAREPIRLVPPGEVVG
jgi:hypothetical protein